jgi:predicted ATPase
VARRELGFIRSLRIDEGADAAMRMAPSLAALDELELHPSVTFFVGANGSGKSTLLEAIAVAAGMNAEGGGRNFTFSTQASHSSLHEHVTLVKRGVPATDYFLRAESFYNVASALDQMGPNALDSYGGTSLHRQSHGESFLTLVVERFGPNGLYLLDEPEAALSTQGQLTLLRRMHELVEDGSQLVIATHSPILVALPGATIYALDDDGITSVSYDDVPTSGCTGRSSTIPVGTSTTSSRTRAESTASARGCRSCAAPSSTSPTPTTPCRSSRSSRRRCRGVTGPGSR